jgi:hypothetical protein
MLATYFLDVKDAVRTHHRFEVNFAFDNEAIQHCKELAAQLRRRRYPDQPGLMIVVLDQSGRKIHDELVYPKNGQSA